ncbi:MAG: hypothetical protein GY909_06665 [Oligoflexia bacterium]|nr:hypothetical protein [Oligoflexia bacterium]
MCNSNRYLNLPISYPPHPQWDSLLVGPTYVFKYASEILLSSEGRFHPDNPVDPV